MVRPDRAAAVAPPEDARLLRLDRRLEHVRERPVEEADDRAREEQPPQLLELGGRLHRLALRRERAEAARAPRGLALRGNA